MARNSGVLVRQLLGNRSKVCAALLHHHHIHKLPSNSFQTIASIPTPPSSPHTTPSTTKPSSNNSLHFPNLHSLQHRPFSSPSGPSNIVLIKSEDEFNTALSKAQGDSSKAIFYFTAVWCGPCRFISPVIGELGEQYPHVTTYKVDIDEEGLGGTLGKLNIMSVPTFHFFQNGKKVAEVIGADVARLKDTFGKLYRQD